MKGHVERVAAELKKQGYEVELFNKEGQKFSKFQIDGETKTWKDISDDFGNKDKYLPRDENGRITNEKILETDMYKADQQWAEKLVNEGYEVIDVGYPEGTTTNSVFYDMENAIIFK